MCAQKLIRSLATTKILCIADDVDYKFSEVTVYLTKKGHRIPFKFNQYYAK